MDGWDGTMGCKIKQKSDDSPYLPMYQVPRSILFSFKFSKVESIQSYPVEWSPASINKRSGSI